MPANTVQSQLWNTVKSGFQSLFPYDTYRTWFEPLHCIEETQLTVTIGVPNEFAAIWIQDNYEDLITRKLSESAGRPISIRLMVQDTQDASETQRIGDSLLEEASVAVSRKSETPTTERVASTKRPFGDIVLNERNTFENFVVGSGNQLAHAACIAVANAPAKAYNPLFLYGDTGLGKTHLMHAIAHHIHSTNPESYIAYVSTESFTNQYIEAIQSNTVARFRQRYRKVNVLLIDDVQFLEGKERIQEEFFHTFNELFEHQKQIVLTSDRPAGEITKLQSRLLSRFQWGLVADIQPPDFETRLAILAKKARAMKLELPDDILQFLAEKVSRNVRRMEGALTRVAGYQSLLNSDIQLSDVQRLLHDILNEEAQQQVTVEKIQQKVADHYKVKVADLTSRKRPANIVLPRHVAMYLSRLLTPRSLQEIGSTFGGRDHGTVIHAYKSVENMMEQDEQVAQAVAYLQTQIGNNRA